MTEKLSIVMPVYNEEAVLGVFIEELSSEILNRFEDPELVIIDDCSTDDSFCVATRCAAVDTRVRVERMKQNSGHGPTLLRAIDSSRADWIFHVDSDRQFMAEDFWKLWRERENADLVLGVRAQRHDPFHRLLLTRVVRLFVSILARRKLQDANVPFKLFKREAWNLVRTDLDADTLAPSIMLAIGTARLGRIVEVDVRHLPRVHAPSTLRAWRLLKFSIHGLVELVSFVYRLRRSSSDRFRG